MREVRQVAEKSTKLPTSALPPLTRSDLLEIERVSATKEVRNSSARSLANYQTLVSRAVDVFGDDTRASVWLSTPSADLDGQVPLKLAEEDDYSLERLEPVFTRIEHGIDF